MADTPADEAGAGNGGGKKKIILLALLAVVLVGFSVGGTLLAVKLLSPPPPEPPPEAAPAEEVVEEPVKKTAIYFPITPSIVVSYDHKGRQRYAQVDVTLLVREPDVIAALELHSPAITNALVMAIGSQLYEEVQTAEGKELLRQQCLLDLQKIIEAELGKPGIEQVLFTNFVMQ
jgi:flagellar protein FliL